MSEEWLEIRARSQQDALEAAVAELGLSSADQVDLEVVEEPQKGLLGFGGKDGLFRASLKRSSSRRRRQRGGSRSNGGSRSPKSEGSSSEKSSDDRRKRNGGGRPSSDRPAKDDKPRSGEKDSSRQRSGSRSPRPESGRSEPSRSKPRTQESRKEEGAEMPDLNEQATVVNDFLVGLLDAFGLEGSVETSVEGEDIIIANVTGEQAEALIGPKGATLQAILELTRTVVQRKTQAGARLRLDIGGYTQRRREALKVYATRLVEQVRDEGQEVMLEPMNPADRKVVHDVVAESDGVRSYSEGEEPRRSVVISPDRAD
ncbi:MAG: Jag N-terminal domain-containing protein [Acidimicrobiia bacterium]|nr:Jag N-terminal domain-containing protein [Acidimicrobiia bacterium]